ncbi:unnamed protein product [Lepeophtheirus salmonis]|uniref:(salmon louse) hypothetical protein n=1 Tax=Lepeophtheirus salmonis TaxID=72036 RepID=A0A7R8CMA0_LEPSM|nr:unnamed protein product [Lepeophtheirus salmonis]CAF2860893.1 unnamed protein product [Lepeophtheirus salmonis]
MCLIMDPRTLLGLYLLCNVNLINGENASNKGGSNDVIGLVGHSATLTCDLKPNDPNDSPYLILWYKNTFSGIPIYSFDTRGNSGQHWMNVKTLGDRASLVVQQKNTTQKAFLTIKM